MLAGCSGPTPTPSTRRLGFQWSLQHLTFRRDRNGVIESKERCCNDHWNPSQEGIPLPGCDNGPALAQGAHLAPRQHHDSRLLRGRPRRGPRPLGHTRDLQHRQGSQFTANPFTEVLLAVQVAISMDGVGRAIDNEFIERLWRTIKYDHIYLNPAESGNALREGLEVFIDYYNEDRPHSSLSDATPDEVYYRSKLQQRAA